jgi:zinc transport system ATP-binding protein
VKDLGEFILTVSDLEVEIQNQIILENINFKIRKGTTLAIAGPNGAGKSMFFKALLNLVPHTGEIKWDEKVKIGYVPQNASVRDIPISVEEFLSYQDGADVESALASVKLDDPSIPNKSLDVLSGGELRRVLVAWAIVDKPNVLLLDEPTVGVDTGSEESIFAMLDNLKKRTSITMLLITHDIHLIKEYTDQLLGLNKCMTFFGDSHHISEPALQQKIYWETICRAGS